LLRFLAALFTLVLATVVVHADPVSTVVAATERRKIVEFEIRGPSKLKIRALRYLTHLEEGSYVRERDRKRIIRDLISSELFESVEVTFEDTPGGIILVATLDDKHSWIAAPTLFVLSGKRAVGLGYAENNFLGLNQKFLVYGQLGDRDSLFFFTFLDQSVRGTPLTARFDLYAYRRLVDEYANPPEDPTSTEILRTTQTNYIGGGFLLGWNFSWWCIADLRLRGAYVYFREAQAPDGAPLTEPTVDGYDWTAQARITLDARHHYFGVTWGPYFQVLAETSIPGLDDYDYSTVLVRAYYSWRLFKEHQFELRGHFNAGRHLPMHEELTLGGTIDLRGYAIDQFRGDLRTMARAEYSLPITKWKFFAFRAIGFWDNGYISYQFRKPDGHRDYLPNQHDGASYVRNDVGVGFRVYVKAIVLPLLGFDLAYGIEGKAPEIYFQVGLTDF